MKKEKNLQSGKAALRGVARMREKFTRDDPGFSVVEYAAEFGLTEMTARYEIRRLVEQGHLVQGTSYRLTRGGARRPCCVFVVASAGGRKD